MSALLKFVAVDESTQASNEIIAAVTNCKICVVGYHLSAAGAVAVNWEDSTAVSPVLLSGVMSMVTGVPHVSPAMPYASGGGGAQALFATSVGKALNLKLSAGVQVGGYLIYYLERVL